MGDMNCSVLVKLSKPSSKGKLMKKYVIGAVLATLVATPALANKQRVTNVEDIYKTVTRNIPQTEQVCNLVEVPIYGEKKFDQGSAIVGGLIGGILGNQVGGGSGKEAATGVGAMAGAIIGGKNGGKQEIIGYRQETRCQNKTTYTTETKEVYSHSVVTFYHEGRMYRVKFNK